jgi:hypothetical protein
MVNRVVSLSVLLCVVVVLIWGVFSPDNPLFLFISSNKWLSIARLIIVGSAVFVSLSDFMSNRKFNRIAYLFGMSLIALGGSILFFTQIQNIILDYLKPLDLLLLVEAGVILASASLAPASSPMLKSRQWGLLLTGFFRRQLRSTVLTASSSSRNRA